MFTQSQVMYSLSRKQANECSIRSTGTIVNYSLDTMSGLFLFTRYSDKLSLIEGAIYGL